MELQPKLVAAADMCEAGEDVNLDELAFLLRYASDELAERPKSLVERDRLMEKLRQRVIARCDLLSRPESDLETAQAGSIEELESLDEKLDYELKQRFALPSSKQKPAEVEKDHISSNKYHSGRI
jgi:hypothetical protein